MTIKDYKLIQAKGNKELAVEVGRFTKEGYELVGSPIMLDGVLFRLDDGRVDMEKQPQWFYAQAIILREPEHAELKRLRDLERHVDQIVTELDDPCTDELGMLTFAHEQLEKGLRGGPFSRKP